MDAIQSVQQKYDFPYELKPEQLAIIKNVINGHHTCGILPTGFGKSDCFVFPQLALDEIYPHKKPHIGLVVSPLRSLMINQTKRWSEHGIKTACILKMAEMTAAEIKDIMEGNCSLVFTSPEAICKEPWRSMLRNEHYKSRLAFLACDEAHCIVEWGDDFRPDYRQVSVLRSLITCPFMILTATATENMRVKILSNLLLADHDVKTIAIIPDRPNIFLHFKSESGMIFENELAWYLGHLRDKGENAKKAIIYCRTIKQVADVYEYFMAELGEKAWRGAARNVENRILDMFHSSLDENTQRRIVSIFPTNDSIIRCLVATVAFGMGVQVDDISIVIHWGASKSILSYWQEVGRCGRDGRNAEAFLYATKRSLVKKRVSDEVISFVTQLQTASDNCVRFNILKHLMVSGMESHRLDEIKNRRACEGILVGGSCTCAFSSCCSNCKRKCKN
ncbi:ATP-dependent DNA helicase RecQ-like [Ptychodera flava]|uniref:ATP-dependent DNA helicase RecQ-like n=1 Tax=Ptychodera flava TaxID=63121 RepID=UPI00396A4B5A